MVLFGRDEHFGRTRQEMVWMVGSTKGLARVREEVGGLICALWVCPTQPQGMAQRTFLRLVTDLHSWP